MALVALASAGLVVGGVAVVSQLASADRPETVASVSTENVGTVPATAPPTTDEQPSGVPEMTGQITIDLGSGPITIDLGQISDCMADLDLGGLGLGEMGELNLGEMGEMPSMPGMPPIGLPGMSGDGTVTVAGPDGLSVIEFGEGDGSVTITRENGELTVTSDGDVTVQQLDDLLDGLPMFDIDGDHTSPGEPSDAPPVPAMPDFSQIEGCLGDLANQLPQG